VTSIGAQRHLAFGALSPSGGEKLGQARAVLLASAGGESPDPPPVWVDAPADLGAAGADWADAWRMARACPEEERAHDTRSVREMSAGVAFAGRNSGQRCGITMRDLAGEEYWPDGALLLYDFADQQRPNRKYRLQGPNGGFHKKEK
jgi:hypothetical protein